MICFLSFTMSLLNQYYIKKFKSFEKNCRTPVTHAISKYPYERFKGFEDCVIITQDENQKVPEYERQPVYILSKRTLTKHMIDNLWIKQKPVKMICCAGPLRVSTICDVPTSPNNRLQISSTTCKLKVKYCEYIDITATYAIDLRICTGVRHVRLCAPLVYIHVIKNEHPTIDCSLSGKVVYY